MNEPRMPERPPGPDALSRAPSAVPQEAKRTGEIRVRRPPAPARQATRARTAAVVVVTWLVTAVLLVLPKPDAEAHAAVSGVGPAPALLGLGDTLAPSDVSLSSPASTTAADKTPLTQQRAVPVVQVVSALTSDGIPSIAFSAYSRAAAASPATCHLAWPLLAAIGRVESDHGRFGGAALRADGLSAPPIIGIPLNGVGTALVRDTDHGRLDRDPVYDHAVGPMQFIPSTWAREARDGNGDGRSDPFNIYDATAAAASYLCAAGGDLALEAGQVRAVLAYNHSASYVAMVLALAASYAGTPPPTLATLPPAPPLVPPVNPAAPPAIAAAAAHLATVSKTSASSSSLSSSTSLSSTTSSSTTAQSTAASSTATSSTTAQSTTTSSSTAVSSSPSSTTTSTSSPPTCPTQPSLTKVDIVNGSTAIVGKDVAAHLTAAGILVGTVTKTSVSTPSAIEYPARQLANARALADSLGAASYLHRAAVPHITVVLNVRDMAPLVAAIDKLPAAPAPTCGGSVPPP